jgi:hypothetical protein
VKYPYDMTEGEMAMIKAMVESPLYNVLCKVLRFEADKTRALLCSAEEPKEMYRLQGRIIGTEAAAKVLNALAQLNPQPKPKEKARRRRI